MNKDSSNILVVDLDNTLINSDIMINSIKWLIAHKPLLSLLIPVWFIKGKANVKQKLLKHIKFNVAKLNYNQDVIDYITQRKKFGNKIILATASAQYYADEVVKHLGLFDKAYGSSDVYNLSSKNKADFLIKEYGKYNFDYAGDHLRDIPIWQVSNLCVIVNASKKLQQKTSIFKTYYINKKTY